MVEVALNELRECVLWTRTRWKRWGKCREGGGVGGDRLVVLEVEREKKRWKVEESVVLI